jgi:hypothetical protein
MPINGSGEQGLGGEKRRMAMMMKISLSMGVDSKALEVYNEAM